MCETAINFVLTCRGCLAVSSPHSGCYPVMAAIRGFAPTIRSIRLKLYANTCRLISVLTFGNVFIKKCVAPIHALSVPKTCSTVDRRIFEASGACSSLTSMRSSTSSTQSGRSPN